MNPARLRTDTILHSLQPFPAVLVAMLRLMLHCRLMQLGMALPPVRSPLHLKTAATASSLQQMVLRPRCRQLLLDWTLQCRQVMWGALRLTAVCRRPRCQL
jgi:hypothetical protein